MTQRQSLHFTQKENAKKQPTNIRSILEIDIKLSQWLSKFSPVIGLRTSMHFYNFTNIIKETKAK